MATFNVDEDLVHHEVAARLHAERHRGKQAYCASDAVLAAAIRDLFAERDWRVVGSTHHQPPKATE